MRLLLDTHVLLWAISAPKRIPRATRRAIQADADEVLVSAATAFEVAIKQSLDKLELPAPAAAWLPERVAEAGFTWLPIHAEDALAVGGLPWLHRDPFDRLIVAQALRHDLALVSADPALRDYGTKVLWE